MRSRPDVLVLGSGGILGEAWLTGVLAGIEDTAGIDLSVCEHFVGTSAGAIVATLLAAGVALERPASAARRAAGADLHAPRGDGAGRGLVGWPIPVGFAGRAAAWTLALGSPLLSAGITVTGPGSALARAVALHSLRRPAESIAPIAAAVDALGARFDGRLRFPVVVRATGRRVVFGRPGAPPASVGEAVAATCAAPWLFAPIAIDGVEYVDGGIWSPTNLDIAPAGRGTDVLCVTPTAGLTGSHPVARAARRFSRSLTAVEAGLLRGRGASVAVVAPDARCAATIGGNLMDSSRRERVLAAAYLQGVALGRERDPELGAPRRRGQLATTPRHDVKAR